MPDPNTSQNTAKTGVAHAVIALEGLRKLPLEEVTLYRSLNMPPRAVRSPVSGRQGDHLRGADQLFDELAGGAGFPQRGHAQGQHHGDAGDDRHGTQH
ncbi:MAG: hypothetical protein WAQ08_04790 [Aquabacterium sp.]|jgi:hypothetical protein|uniref:hypothetical protein n=1 Tax=Aquabacterium sp. TaxID=1872578 RepID=UPI003BAF4FA4